MLIGIAGPTSCGKTTIAQLIESECDSVLSISLDNFFNDRATYQTYKNWINCELPQNLDFESLYISLKELKIGNEFTMPIYSRSAGRRIGKKVIHPRKFNLIEGFLLFYEKRIREILDIRIFIDLSKELQLVRRLKRQPSLDITYFNEVIVPSYKQYIEPTKKYAHYIVDGSGSVEKVGRDIMQILSSLQSDYNGL